MKRNLFSGTFLHLSRNLATCDIEWRLHAWRFYFLLRYSFFHLSYLLPRVYDHCNYLLVRRFLWGSRWQSFNHESAFTSWNSSLCLNSIRLFKASWSWIRVSFQQILKIFKIPIFYFRRTIQDRHQDWPWQMMYQDLLWAMEILQNPDATFREFRVAATIIQTWIGQVENMRVFHRQSQDLQPIVE